jgi:hypothetical protein
MCRADESHPGFGFADHVGYSTPEHRAAIIDLGPSVLHRRSFASIAYSQLELAQAGGALEGAADVLPLGDAAASVEPQADDVEADRVEAG